MTSRESSSDDERRVEELLRVNAELAAEIRSLTLDRTAAPRSGAGTSSRRVSRLIADRDALMAERDSLAAALEVSREDVEASRSEVESLRQENDSLNQKIGDQASHLDALSHEVTRLRSGVAGFARRILAWLTRRR